MKKKYIIWAPDYSYVHSGGVTCLHKLCSTLNELGEEAYLYFPSYINVVINPDYNIKICKESDIKLIDDFIVLYPEIVDGNPLNAKHVVRWLLNTPKVISGNGEYSVSDIFFKFAEFVKVPSQYRVSGKLSCYEFNLDVLVDRKQKREGTAFQIRKGYNKSIPDELEFFKPIDRYLDTFNINQLCDYFNSIETFVTMDDATFYSLQAALCGAISVVIRSEGVSKEQFRNNIPLLKYGVAYGFDDIKYAVDTLSIVREHVKEIEQQSSIEVKKFIEITQAL